jgi:hypothetical protein
VAHINCNEAILSLTDFDGTEYTSITALFIQFYRKFTSELNARIHNGGWEKMRKPTFQQLYKEINQTKLQETLYYPTIQAFPTGYPAFM